ncbi:hypothetical protein EPN15_01505 [Patescibacteria group bacterium]|nr:MAG: hypothetical protein EPN15_01505 [Patescibacteria group bacterium]
MSEKKETVLTAEEAKSIVTALGPSLGCGDFTYDPVFPKNRKDVAAVRRMAEDGHSYGFDTVYLIWKDRSGVHYNELINSRSTKDYISIDEVTADGGKITVKVGSGGSYSGSAWKKTITRTI